MRFRGESPAQTVRLRFGPAAGAAGAKNERFKEDKTMKILSKAIAALVLVAVSVTSAACTASKPQTAVGENATTAPTQDTELTTEAPAPEMTERYAIGEFFRVDYSESAASLAPKVITTADQFAETVLPQVNEEKRDALRSAYNEEFFKDHHLITFFVTYGSGSIIPQVSSVETENGSIAVSVVGTHEGDILTCDMATHLCLLSVDNVHFPIDAPVVVSGQGVSGGTEQK